MTHRLRPLLVLICRALVVVALAGPPARGQGTHWTRLDLVPSPSARYHSAMVYDAARARVVLYGGYNNQPAVRSADTWEWDGAQWTLSPATGPGTRSSHSMVYDSLRGVTILFGGTTEGNSRFAVWEYDGQWTARSVQSPVAPPELGARMVFDSARGVCVYVYLGSTWEWNPSTGVWVQRSQAGPSARIYPGLAYDAARNVTVLFGGVLSFSSGPVYSDTWEWNGAAGTWTQRTISGPSGRYDHAMVYDPTRQVVLLQGGILGPGNSPQASDTWEYDGAWAQRPSAGPARAGQSLAFDETAGRPIMFSGYMPNTNLFGINETWTLGPCAAPVITTPPEPRRVCPGQPAVFSIAATGPLPLVYHWRRIAGGNPPVVVGGDATFTIALPTSAHQGAYDCVVSGGPNGACGSATSTAVLLTVCLADFDCSGATEVQDIFDFLNAWIAGDAAADFDRAAGLEVQDIFDFLNAWLQGC